MTRLSTLVVPLAMGAAVAGCTDVFLSAVGRVGDRVALEGEFCTSPPEVIPATTRFVFMIDNSDSMRLNDEDGFRFDAVEAVIEKEFGVVISA